QEDPKFEEIRSFYNIFKKTFGNNLELSILSTKRPKSKFLQFLLAKDEIITTKFVIFLLKYEPFKAIKAHTKALELSCDGIIWLTAWPAFIWLASNKSLYQMQINLLFGLILDIVITALIKAAVRRRRPSPTKNLLSTIGPDKFSFPSGHASRSAFIMVFFIMIYPLYPIFWAPLIVWCFCVCLSRVLAKRHFILDSLCGFLIGLAQAYIITMLYISEQNAIAMVSNLSSDHLPGGSE
uniref:Phosphatidic acid phosphatase type 2/haloperoxidase domain-containing protein n=1 Tax=Glossina morsitans morsitans TaxID=37546 RepID=A0A1B0GAM9_GLOMM